MGPTSAQVPKLTIKCSTASACNNPSDSITEIVRLEQFDYYHQKQNEVLHVNMENMDFLPPIVPSLVFARETCTSYYKTGHLERENVFTSIATHGCVIKKCALQKHELYRVPKNIHYVCIVMLLLLALPANSSPPSLLNPPVYQSLVQSVHHSPIPPLPYSPTPYAPTRVNVSPPKGITPTVASRPTSA